MLERSSEKRHSQLSMFSRSWPNCMAAAIASSFLRLPHGLFWIRKGQIGKKGKDYITFVWKMTRWYNLNLWRCKKALKTWLLSIFQKRHLILFETTNSISLIPKISQVNVLYGFWNPNQIQEMVLCKANME